MKATAKIIALVIVVVFVFGVAYAQFAKPKDAIKYRKAVMTLILHHFKGMGAVVQGKADYDKGAFAVNAEAVNMLATLPLESSLVPGSDKGDTTMTSAALDSPGLFKKAAKSFEGETAELARLANDGDLNAAKGQFGKVAKSCGACHKKFRKD